ncbi:MAG TPA: IS630 family transposase [Candidatus Dormibacteraeota bacterium]
MRSSMRPSSAPVAPRQRPRQPDRNAQEVRRRRAAELFKEGQTQAEVARFLEVSRQSASRWYESWRQGGLTALKKAPRAGRPPQLTAAQLRQVERALLKGARANGYTTELWTLQRVAEVIARRTGVEYHPGHVWKLLRKLGWSRQKPARRAAERDQAAVETWVRERWPELKKTPDEIAPGSSSKTRADSR